MKKETNNTRNAGRKKHFNCETEVIQIMVPKHKAKELKIVFREIAKKSDVAPITSINAIK